MITRIEIDGFKTFEGFSLDLQPFVVIAGANASGKSNLFDAIQLLSRLADLDLRSAVNDARGEPLELFRRYADGHFATGMRFAVEVLIPPKVRDPWGQEQELIQTRLRYEITIERRRDAKGLERLYVADEDARPVRASTDHWAARFKPRQQHPFARAYLRYGRDSALLETEHRDEGPRFAIHQDGSAGRVRPAVAAEATVLSSITSAEFKHLFALREELRSWRFLQLDPADLRDPVPLQTSDRLAPSGWNLAAVLARIKAETSSDDDPQGLLAELSADLAHLIPGVTGVDVREDEASRRWEITFRTQTEPPYSGRVASDGTLRILTLLTALSDPAYGGVICFEEPENGVHPARLKPLVNHLRRLVTNPDAPDLDATEPLLQLLVSTHSPVVVSALLDHEGVFFDPTTVASGDPAVSGRRTSARQFRQEIQGTLDPSDVEHLVTRGEVERYLATASRTD